MVQGTGSHVGKSMLVAGLCRAAARRGVRVAPFKPQNMSNNAAATPDGGEIGRAQALQARAAGVAPSVDMNPVLLKPETEKGAQVVVQGKQIATMAAAEYMRAKAGLMPRVLESYRRVAAAVDLVVIEGAGSPAEVNLRPNDIANMGFAAEADIPVVLIADIDRGGVIASLVGTHAVLDAADRDRIRGFVVNKFRGDAGLFVDGVKTVERRTGWPCFGVVPWFDDADRLPAEDVLGLATGANRHISEGVIKIAVPRLPRIANFDDLDPLNAEPGVDVLIVEPGQAFPADADLVLIPGSKSTVADLEFVKAQGWDIDIKAHWRRGGRVLGLCGGYQMLGRSVCDPETAGGARTVDGLGLLDIATVLEAKKTTRLVSASDPEGRSFSGYEIHLGVTDGPDTARPFCTVGGRPEGARSADGLVAGTYLHGLFASDGFRSNYLAVLGVPASELRFEARVEAALEALADHLEAHLDVSGLLALAGYNRPAAKGERAPSSARKTEIAPT